jgi:hypothetical protein
VSIHLALEATCEGILDFMRVEEEWCIRHEDGFTWWPHQHAQHVRIERATDRRGRAILTLTVHTDLIEGFEGPSSGPPWWKPRPTRW